MIKPHFKSLNLKALERESPWKILEFKVYQVVGTLYKALKTDVNKKQFALYLKGRFVWLKFSLLSEFALQPASTFLKFLAKTIISGIRCVWLIFRALHKSTPPGPSQSCY